jgi:hypothetical protein
MLHRLLLTVPPVTECPRILRCRWVPEQPLSERVRAFAHGHDVERRSTNATDRSSIDVTSVELTLHPPRKPREHQRTQLRASCALDRQWKGRSPLLRSLLAATEKATVEI